LVPVKNSIMDTSWKKLIAPKRSMAKMANIVKTEINAQRNRSFSIIHSWARGTFVHDSNCTYFTGGSVNERIGNVGYSF
jgi:hypothetical protein